MSVEYFKEIGGHHAFQKSNYFKPDKDESWNKFSLSKYDHDCVHHASTDDMIVRGKAVAKRCREVAIERYQGKFLHKLVEIMQNRYGNSWIGFEKYGKSK